MSEDKKTLDDYRGMNADDFKKSVEGKSDNKTQVNKQKLNEVNSSSDQNDNSAPEPQKQETANNNQPQQTNDANVDQKDVSVLANTFGVEYESLPDSAREGFLKMAKSYREAQGKYTSQSQKLKQLDSTLENFNQFLSKNSDIQKQIQSRLNGNQPEDKDTPSKPESSSVGKSVTVDEKQLMKDGYLDESQLTGLDELTRQREVAKAELQYLRDQEIAKFREGLQQEKQKLSEAERAEQVKKTNQNRADDGIDRVVADYGIDFTALDDDVVQAIFNRSMRILDPSDPTGRTIDKDATYDATLKELAIRDMLPKQQPPQQKKTVDGITDTGVQFNKRGPQVKKSNTREDYYQKQMAQRKSNIKDTLGVFAPK